MVSLILLPLNALLFIYLEVKPSYGLQPHPCYRYSWSHSSWVESVMLPWVPAIWPGHIPNPTGLRTLPPSLQKQNKSISLICLMWTLCLPEWKASGSQKSQTVFITYPFFGLLAFIKKKVSNLKDSINSSPRSTSPGWWRNGWKDTYKEQWAHMFLNFLLMKKHQALMSIFQACITQQGDTVVHSRTLDLFIWKAERQWERFKRNFTFKILTQYHLHNWVRKWNTHACHLRREQEG